MMKSILTAVILGCVSWGVLGNPVLVSKNKQISGMWSGYEECFTTDEGNLYYATESGIYLNDKVVDQRIPYETQSCLTGIGNEAFYTVEDAEDGSDFWFCSVEGTTVTNIKKFENCYGSRILEAGKNTIFFYFTRKDTDPDERLELWKYTIPPTPAPPSTKVNAKKISVKLDSSKPAKDSISISKAEFPSDQTFDPEVNKVSLTIGEYEFTLDTGEWKSKNGVHKYKSKVPKVQLTIDTNKHTWDFKVAKTEVYEDVDVSKDIPIYLKIDDTLIGNDFAMTLKAKLDYKQ